MTRCRCVGTSHTCGIQTIVVQSPAVPVQAPNVVYVGQGGPKGIQGPRGAQGATGAQGTTGIQGVIGTQGTTGIQGIQGIQGVQGTDGGGVTLQQLSDAISASSLASTDELSEGLTNLYFTTSRVSYIHTQNVVSDSWEIVHNLGFYPNLTVQDSAGTIYEGEVSFTNSNSLTVTFQAAFSGIAYLS